MQTKWFNLLVLLSLILGLVPVTAARAASEATPPAQPAAQDPGNIEVEEVLRNQLAADETTGYLIYFREKPDLSPAYEMDWIERGRFVANALNQTALRSQASVRAYLDAQGATYKAFWIENVISVESSNRATFDGLLNFPEIDAIRQHRQLGLIEPEQVAMPSAPQAVEPNISHVGADQVWAQGYTGEGIVVANIDTGVRYTHQALVNHYRGNLGGTFDHNYSWWDPYGDHPATPGDDNGHGSHTMGTMVGDDGGANQIGMAPGAKWMACRGCNTSSCTDTALLECAQFVAAPWDLNQANANPDKRPNAVNNSWGDCSQSYDPWYQGVVDAWHAAGIYPIFSNGNASNCGYPAPPGLNTVGNPARYGNVTGIGSTGRDNGQYAPHSNWGPTDNLDTVNPHPGWEDLKPQVLAPGVNIRSSVNTGDSAYEGGWGGTSMSAPHVTGLIALMWQAAPCLVGDYATTENIIENTATPIAYDDGTGGGAHVPNYAAGWGEINAPAAVQAAMGECGDSAIVGQVTASGAPVAGALVTAVNPTTERKTTTDAQGNYALTVFSATYTLQAMRYGYQTAVVPNVVATTGATTTQNIALIPAQMYEVSGQVTDATTGWPLYAHISISGDPLNPIAPNNSVWTDPVSGQYSVMLAEGITYTFKVEAWVAGYTAAVRKVGPLVTEKTENFALNADLSMCQAPGYTMLTGMGMQSFEETFPPAGWSLYDLDGGDPIWKAAADGHTGASSALHAYGPYGVPQDGWLVSSQISLDDTPVLSFFENIAYSSYYYKHSLWVCTSDCSSPPVNFTEVAEFDAPLATEWTEQTVNLSAYANQDVVVAFRYEGDWADDWYVDDVKVSGECVPPANGGLVVGNVYDGNYPTIALNGAEVVNGTGYKTTAVATPLDNAVDDAFYTLFAPAGTEPFMASAKGGYASTIALIAVPDGDTVEHDFFLPAGLLSTTPPGLDVTVELGYTAARTLTLLNAGGASASFDLMEHEGTFVPIHIAAFVGTLLDSDVPNSTGPAPQDATRMGTAGTPSAPLGADAVPAFAMDANTGDLVAFMSDTPGTWTVIGNTGIGGPFAGDFLNGDFSKMYVLDYYTNALYSVDTATANATVIGPATPQSGHAWTGMTASVDGALYASSTDGSQSYLYTLDPNTGAATVVGQITNGPIIIDIAIDTGGEMYGLDIGSDELLAIDPATGAGTVIGSVGFDASYAQGMDFEEESGVLYLAAFNVGNFLGELRIADTQTGNSVLVGTFPGGAEVDCLSFATGGSADVPWLMENPVAGSVPATGSIPVTVNFDAAYVDQPGKYTAELIVKNDTPYGKFSVPVTMTVSAPQSWGKLTGTVTGLGVCDADPALLAEAEVLVESVTTGQTWLVKTGLDGVYHLWLDQGHSPLIVTVTAPDYYGQATGVIVAQGQTTVVDFDLRLLKPCLSYNPADFDVTLPMGDNTAEPLTLSNTGAGDAAFEMVEKVGGFIPLNNVRLSRVTIGDVVGDNAFTANPQPASAPSASYPMPEAVAGLEILTHSLSQEIMAGNSVACNNGFAHTDNSYIRTFYLPDFGITSDFSIVEVDMGIEMATGGGGSQAVEVRLYTLDGALLWGNMTLIGQAAVDISDQDLTHFAIPVTGLAPTGSTLVVEFFTPDGNAGGNLLFVGSNNLGQTAPTYLAAADCGVTEPMDVADIGFPGMHLVMNVTGMTGGAAGIPWLTETPVSGTVAADTDAVVNLTFDAGVPETMQPGTYYGALKIASNAANDVPNVPVTLTVTAPDTWGKVAGTVTGLGYCDTAIPALLADAEVIIETHTGVVWTLLTDANGEYAFWLDAAHSPLTITVSYPDHVTQVFTNVAVTGGHTTVVDAPLRWARPCLTVDPDLFDVTVTLGTTTTLPLSLINQGAGAAAFELGEKNGGVMPLAVAGGHGEWLYRAVQGVEIQSNQDTTALAYPSSYRWEPAIPSAFNVLVYADDFMHTAPNTYVDQALQALGIAYTAHYGGDFSGFASDLASGGPWDLVIFENANYRSYAVSFPEMLAYVQGGGKLAAEIWTMFDDNTNPLYAEMGVAYVNNDLSVPPVYWWESDHPIFNNPQTAPEWLSRYCLAAYSCGQYLNPVNGVSTALAGYTTPGPDAGQGALILRDDGQTVFKGFSDTTTDADSDSDGIMDGAELWENIVTGLLEGFGADIPWLFENPESGTVDADTTFDVDLTFDAGATYTEIIQPGKYFGTLFVNSDDPVNAKVPVPVTMTVAPPATWGKLMGTVTSLGYCDADPAPVAGLEVLIEGSGGMTWTTTTDASGMYQLWLESGPVTVTVLAPEHSKGEATATIVAGETTVQDFNLRWLVPCVQVDPPALHAELELGATATRVMTLTNTGAVDTDWRLAEENLGAPTVTPPGVVVLFSEAFEGAFPPAGWTRVLNSGTNWESSATTGYPNQTGGTGLFADANSDSWGSGMDAELWTPALDFSTVAAPVLNFRSDFSDLGALDDGYVDVSTDGGTTWTNLLHYDGVDVRGPRLVQLDLSAYAGQPSVIIRFHYVAPYWDWYWQVDDVQVVDVDSVIWLDENPASGTLLADTGEQVVDVDFDATVVDQPGDYVANLWVNSDDPYAPTIVPVTMTVTPPASWGQLLGTVYSLGRCEAEMNPLAGAEVVIWDDMATAVVTLTTDAAGAYHYWLPTGDYTVTVTAADHVAAAPAVVNVPASGAVTQDFSLVWIGPCVTSIVPSSMEVTVAMGMSTTLPLTMTNAGAGALAFKLSDEDGGWLPTMALPTGGTVVWLSRNTEGVAVSGADSGKTVAYPAAYRYVPDRPAAFNVLVYTDDWQHTSPNTYPELAVQRLGLAATVHVDGDYAGFVTDLTTGGPWDLVIWSGENYVIDTTVMPALLAYVQGGGALAATYWQQLNVSTDPLWAAMDFAYVQNDMAAPPAYWWNPAHALFTNPEGVPEWLTRFARSGTSQGTYIEPLAEGVAVAGYTTAPAPNQANIVIGNDGRTVYKGIRDLSTDADADTDGVVDGVELWENIIYGLLYGFGNDAPWLFEDPETGTVPAMDAFAADIIFDAGVPEVIQPGDYMADLIVQTDDPVVDKVTIPVTMHVTLPADYGQLIGTVEGLGLCDDPLTAVLLEGAEVTVESATQVWSLTTDANGVYDMWLNEAHSPVTITASANGYATKIATGVQVISSTTTVQDFSLSPVASCMSVAPDSIHEVVTLGMSTTVPMTISNSGAGALNWTTSDADEGFVLAAPIHIPAASSDFSQGAEPASAGVAPLEERPKVVQAEPETPVTILSPGTIGYATEPNVGQFLSVDMDTPQTLNFISAFTDWIWAGDFDGDGVLYAINSDMARLETIDPATGASTSVGSIAAYGGESWTGMAFDPTTGNMYASTASCGSRSTLYSVNIATGAATVIGQITNASCAIALAVDDAGMLYTYDIVNDVLLSVDKASGAGSVIGSIGFDANYGQGMDFDYASGQMYMAAFNGGTFQGELRVVDRATGATALVGVLGQTTPGGTNQLGWLALPSGGGDAPWLFEDPENGVTPAADTSAVTITLDAGVPEVTQPGDYYATLKVKGDNATVEVPVTMTVEAPATWGKLTGLVQSLGYCDAMTTPLQGAVVYIESAVTELVTYTVETVVYEQDFESGNGGFTHSGTYDEWEWGAPTYWPSGCASGSMCWGTDLDSDYENSSDQTLLSPVIDLSGVTVGSSLTAAWQQAWALEGCCDFAYAEVSINGGAWTQMWSGNGAYNTWVEKTYDISAAAGGNVQFRWRLTSDSSVVYPGYFVDALRITTPVEVSEWQPVNWTLTTDANGMYGIWFDELYSPVTVTISHEAGHEALVFTGVDVNAGEITTLNANLHWLQPCMQISPDAMAYNVPMGSTFNTTLNIANLGAVAGVFLVNEWNNGFEMLGPLAAGGPDTFGYQYADSNALGLGPSYDFVDISGMGMPVTLGDNTFVEVPIGFDFKFYGTSAIDPDFYDAVFVNSNGFLSFGAGSTDISPDPVLPDPTLPNNIIAVAWDDLKPGANGMVYVESFGQCPYNPYPATVDACFIAQYDNFVHADGSPAGTWEVILFHSGSILMQYAEVDAPDATTGIEGPLGLAGLTYGPTLADELAICFAYPGEWLDCQSAQVPWLSVDVTEGSVDAYHNRILNVTFDAGVPEVAAPGTYMAELWVMTNDPHQEFTLIPVTMTVAAPATMGKMWGTIYAWNQCDVVSATMANASVMIQSSSGEAWMMYSGANGEYGMWLPVGETVTMTVLADGYVATTMVENVTIGVMPAHNVNLRMDAPCISLSPTSYDVTLPKDRSTTRTFTIHNAGAGDLAFNNILGSSMWLSVQPKSGVVPAGSDLPVTVTFDATGLVAGDVYSTVLEVVHADPDVARLLVRPVRLTVLDAPQLLVDVVKTASPADMVLPGGLITYTVTFTNTYDRPLDLAATDPIPVNTTYVLASVSGGASVLDPPANMVVWNGTLAANATATFGYVVHVGTDVARGTLITNTVTIVTDGLTFTDDVVVLVGPVGPVQQYIYLPLVMRNAE